MTYIAKIVSLNPDEYKMIDIVTLREMFEDYQNHYIAVKQSTHGMKCFTEWRLTEI